MAGAAAFQIGITLSVAPPLSYVVAEGLPRGSRSAAFTYMGNGYSALPAAAIFPMNRATDHAWKYSSALSPKTFCHEPPETTGVFNALSTPGCSNSAGTGPSN